jgi:hypothetical protein
VCTDCHTSHEIIQPDKVAFKLASGDRCGKCHEDRIEHYRETFHGKALALGAPSVAACYDCHGHHDIVPLTDPTSRLAGEQQGGDLPAVPPGRHREVHRLHRARRPHQPQALPALYWTFIFMTAIVVGTFLFFGAHTILWFVALDGAVHPRPQGVRARSSAAPTPTKRRSSASSRSTGSCTCW